MPKIIPDWMLQLTWFAAGVCATGAIWYFLAQKRRGGALLAGLGAFAFAALAVAFHIRNDHILTRAVEYRTEAGSPEPSFAPRNVTPESRPRVAAAGLILEEQAEAKLAVTSRDFSPMSSDEYFTAWYETSKTSLQRDDLESRMLNKRVIWSGTVDTIKTSSEGAIEVVVKPPSGIYGSAFLEFDASQREMFLPIEPKQTIRFTCLIKNFVASPFLKECKLLSVAK